MPDAEREAIRAATTKLLEAVNTSDVAGVMSVWADDGVLMLPNHPTVRGGPEIERYFRGLFETSRVVFVFTASNISIDGNAAVEYVEYVSERWIGASAASVSDTGKGLHLYVRRGGEWKLAFDVWNSDGPRPA
ncbi:MAG TPA: DUF4440 domain-containing protein [Thermoanaerobaculia bacterium]|nr:DUF4440 domain-containing protein [Thermoanaerobaculia bacterium]